MTDNRVTLITGASKGLGYTLAEFLAARGYNLIINARTEAALQTASKKVSGI